MSESRGTRVNAQSYYGEYHGHKVRHLKIVHDKMRAGEKDSIVFLAGDSSLDNKYWFDDTVSAIEPYSKVLTPGVMKPDVAYWLTKECDKRKLSFWGALNCSVEESTVGDRWCGNLLPQDQFIRDNIRSDDILVVSVGGNDIALKPAPCTIVNMIGLICCTPTYCIEHGDACPLPCDDCCCGCGFGCLSTMCACPPCGGYFAHLFRIRIQNYLRRLTAKTKPRAILINMIYYPDEKSTGSWADRTLNILGYNSNPGKLQLLIRKMFQVATSRISVPGTEVIPVPLYEVLDGKNTRDYCARVEPSARGGEKMAKLILDRFAKGREVVDGDVVAMKR
eukprot:g4677.t1